MSAGFRGGILGGEQVRFAGRFEALESELGMSSTYIYIYMCICNYIDTTLVFCSKVGLLV